MNNRTLERLDMIYVFDNQSPDVQHRFAELIIKHNYLEKLPFVETFLRHHQSMGIYLYGEMAISKHKMIRKLVEQIFNQMKEEMDPIMLINVREMLYGVNL